MDRQTTSNCIDAHFEQSARHKALHCVNNARRRRRRRRRRIKTTRLSDELDDGDVGVGRIALRRCTATLIGRR